VAYRTGMARRVAADLLREEMQTDGPPVSSLSTVFEREPMPLQRFITEQVKHPPLSPLQYDFLHHLERIYLSETYIAMVEEFGTDWMPTRTVHMMTLMVGKGGGKDSMCRLGVMRAADLLNALDSPQHYFGLPEQDDIHLLNVASSTDQARRAFFNPMRRMFQINPHMMSILRGNPPGEMAIEIRLAKNVMLVSGNSDAETQEGLNILIGIADEISAFKTTAELIRAGITPEGRSKKTAEGIVKMLRTSARSRFPQSFKVVQISYPRFKGDAIMQAASRARAEQKRAEIENRPSHHYLLGPVATWEFNPRVNRADFAEDYEEDPAMASTMYECKPSSTQNRYLKDDMRIGEAFERSIPEPITVEYFWGLPTGRVVNEMAEEQAGWQVRFHFNDQVLRPMKGAQYALHGDLSVVGDRAGVAMSHVRTYKVFQTQPGTPADRRPVIRNDFVCSFEADLTARAPDGSRAPREVQIRWYRQLIWELRSRRFRIASATFDGFQCLSGSTQIPLLDGTVATMQELAQRYAAGEDDLWVYSNDRGQVVPGRITRAEKTGRKEIYEVVLDNGQIVRCSDSHPFMLRDGSYRRADQLTPDTSLMPLYRRYRKVSPTSKYYEQIRHHSPGGARRHWSWTHQVVSEAAHGAVPKGWVSHHLDHNSLNNRPDNLLQMSSADHSSYHAGLGNNFDRLWADPEWRAAHRSRLSAAQGERNRARTGLKRNKGLTLEDLDQAYDAAVAESTGRGSRDIAVRLGCGYNVVQQIAMDAGFESWKAYRRARGELRLTVANNHKVIEVRRTGVFEDVYDLSVPGCDNFALSAGVFVHNSVDMIQLLTAKGINSKKVSLDVLHSPVYSTLKDVIADGRLDAYYRQRVIDELKGLSKMPSGKIDHMPGGSKDEADALAGSIYGAIQCGGSEGDRPQAVDAASAPSLSIPATTGVMSAFGDTQDLMGLGAFGGSGSPNLEFGSIGGQHG
jgi:hypothetical protein